MGLLGVLYLLNHLVCGLEIDFSCFQTVIINLINNNKTKCCAHIGFSLGLYIVLRSWLKKMLTSWLNFIEWYIEL